MPRRSLHELVRRGVLLLAVLVVLVAVTAAGMVLLTRSYTEKEEETREALLSLKDLRFNAVEAETGLRGYVLVGRKSFLEPYETGIRAFDDASEGLGARVVPDGRAELRRAVATFTEWRSQFAEVVLRFLAADRLAAAQRLIDSGAGKRRIDSVRDALARVETAEREELDTAQRNIDRAEIALLMVVLILAAVVLLMGIRLLGRLNRAVVLPIHELAQAAARIRKGELHARVHPRGAVETQAVGEAFNDMAAQVEQVVTSLRELDESKSQFISTVSHELRTPLTSIVGYIELALEEMPGEDPDSEAFVQRRQFLEVAERNTRRLQRLVNDLLFLAQSEAGRVHLQREPTDLAQLAAESAEAAKPYAESNGVELVLDTNGPVEASVDPGRIAQVIDNLVSNAIKFTPAGGRVRLSLREGPGGASIEVSDSGMGIGEEEQDSLFERFFRTAAAGEAAIQGAGLGLAIVKSIVDAHDGTITVDSRESEGATFRVELPR